MVSIPMLSLAVLCTALAGYAQYRLSRHIRGGRNIVLTRIILIVVGCIVGSLFAASYPLGTGQLLALLIGFGAVHAPAAAILFLKSAGRMGKS